MDIAKFFKNHWIIALFLLAVFFATSGYIYGWDDQHIEIPLLKKLINPDLYPNDYYVSALKKDFMSYLYPLLAMVIPINGIPSAYMILFILCRYGLLVFMYKIWFRITRQPITAILCVLMIMVHGRVEEFLYRTFSHQEFSLAFIFAGIYMFYRNRFLAAAVIFGFSANFHAIYSLFPMSYLGLYLILQRRWRRLFEACAGFLITAIPFLFWTGKKYFISPEGSPQPTTSEWIPLYQLACPQNFLFLDSQAGVLFKSPAEFWIRAGLFCLILAVTLLHSSSTRRFHKDRKTQVILLGGGLYLGLSFIFSYIIPSRLILDLNLIRNTQYMLFFLWGYLIIFLKELAHRDIRKFFLCLLIFPFLRFGNYSATLAVLLMGTVLLMPFQRHYTPKELSRLLLSIPIAFLLIGFLLRDLTVNHYSRLTYNTLILAEILALAVILVYVVIRGRANRATVALIAVSLQLILSGINFIIFHKIYYHVERTGLGFWQLQRNWIDMQHYVRNHTAIDAVILVPYDMEMGGFRIHSERSLVMSYRDCGIIGFDYQAGLEWKKRLDDIRPFRVLATQHIELALFNAIKHYDADYVVFMKYYAPPNSFLSYELYQNEAFSLHKIKRP